ncbi:baseplate wedge subunit [Acinetobacter phage 133]|uniref:Gp25 baseplate wedge subunit n=1 Tax=Acinetobacter phage 133 TaxID=2919552 RepID=D9I6C4_9CAUD|nr:baseplate wedge subunit [Acinetobacter phage 133]ADJ19505.1 gp25 baseplate wedge subunit [Acinetobacter phage 133]
MSNIDQMYTDLNPGMEMNWDRDLAKSVGARAVKNSILGIVTTRKGSRPFDPEFGCNLSDQLFENMTPLVADTMERVIMSSIRTYEPRVVQLRVSVTPEYDRNTVIVEVRFSILDNPDTLEQIKFRLNQG